MTSEEAIKMLKTEKACVERQGRKQNCNRYCESCDLCMPIEDVIEGYNYAIRALKNEQTDGDLISRDYVLSKFKEQCDRCGKYKENNGVMCRCCALDDAIDYVEDAPSVEKTAEWISKDDEPISDWECSNCGFTFYEREKPCYALCPNCGSKMKEGDTE